LGFSGGGSNILKAHKHTSAVQDGGQLDMDNVTEAELTAGDVIFSDGNALQRLAIGAATNALVVNGAATAPEWAAGGSSPVVTVQNAAITNGSTTTSPTFVDIPGSSLTLPTRAGGYALLSACFTVNGNAVNSNIKVGIYHGGSLQEVQVERQHDASNESSLSVTGMQALDGSLVKCQYAINSSYTATIINIATMTSTFQSFEVS